MAWQQWAPYVPVAERRRRAMRKMDALRKKGVDIQPVEIEGRKITRTFWGQAWCDHLESFSDFENRLPRGRTYVRNGSVCHLEIAKGTIEAKVAGSEIYEICIEVKTLPKKKWNGVKQRCAGQVGSLLELLRGNLSDNVMQVVTHRTDGLFPLPSEISLDCDCPDWATMCKHVAAALYGVGARLDHSPELLFLLRGVDHGELIDTDAEAAVSAATAGGRSKRLDTADLSSVFGVDIEPTAPTKRPKKKAVKKTPAKKKSVKKKVTKKPAKKKAAKKKTKKTPIKKKAAKKKAAKKKVAKRPAKKKAAKKSAKRTTKKKPAARAKKRK